MSRHVRRATALVAMLGAGWGVAYAQGPAPAPPPADGKPGASGSGSAAAPPPSSSSSSPPSNQPDPWLAPEALVRGRCATAICLNANGKKGWLGIEPLVELPIGEQFTFNSGGLADYVNNTDLKVSFTAGLRVWILQDWVSFSVYLSQPVTPKDSKVRLSGSTYEYPASFVRRPYPGLAIGVLFDTLWLGIDRDELRNGSDGSSNINPQFPPNGLVSGVWTFTVAIQPFTAFRTGIGTVLTKQNASSPSAAPSASAPPTQPASGGGGGPPPAPPASAGGSH